MRSIKLFPTQRIMKILVYIRRKSSLPARWNKGRSKINGWRIHQICAIIHVYKITIKVNKMDLLNSIERASILSKEGSNNLIKINITGDKMIITSRSEEGM